jgi:ATP-dependent RNA helicase DeaD
MSSEQVVSQKTFSDLGLPDLFLQTIEKLGYTQPTPIQNRMIPHMLAGDDVVGQAETGTGKTAAFALPLLAMLKKTKKIVPQVLVLAPTRELAIQVADAFTQYGAQVKGLNVLPIFGGQDYSIQLKQLQRGAQVIVGTPGRVMDHIRRGSLDPKSIHSLVLDEADEMLRMGFLDDVQWVLDRLPNRQQTALFSATMPSNIRRIAHKYLQDPVEITIKSKTMTASTVSQRYLFVAGGFARKVDALSKILEAEPYDGMLIFVRTKAQTVELAEKAAELGYLATALNGDIQQSQRLRTIEQLKSGKIDILVATDVAARGLDVERISHVINFDIPFDTEAYVHRIGRTGRAGRQGKAILFVNPRERSMLRSIERVTRQKIQEMDVPNVDDINRQRTRKFKDDISTALATDTAFFDNLLKEYIDETGADTLKVAAALAQIHQGKKQFLLEKEKPVKRVPRDGKEYSLSRSPKKYQKKSHAPSAIQLPPEEGFERFRVDGGNNHGVKAGNIVGAIANEADINSKHIGRISIYDNYSTVDLPYGMPSDTLRTLQRARIGSRKMGLKRIELDNKEADTAPHSSPASTKTVKTGKRRKFQKPAIGAMTR